jgi:hypothetical protein
MDTKTGEKSEPLEERRVEVVKGTFALPPCRSCMSTEYKWVMGINCSNCYADQGRAVPQSDIRSKEDAEIDAKLKEVERSVAAEQEALEQAVTQRTRRIGGLGSVLREAAEDEPLPADLSAIKSVPGAMPLTDLQIRLRLLRDAGAKYYKDGVIEIHLEGRPQRHTPGTF